MRFLLILTTTFLLTSCASTPVPATLRGRAVIQFEQHEFFECGNAGRVLTIGNPEKFRKAKTDATPEDVYYKVEGTVSQPGEPGSVGITAGVLTASKVEAMKGARLACSSSFQGM